MACYLFVALIFGTAVAAGSTGQEQSKRPHPMEDGIRLSLFHGCGDDRVPVCEQFAPRILRGKDPVIALEDVHCDQSGQYPRMKQACSFRARSPQNGKTTNCTIRFQQLPGDHSPYWSDRDPTADPPPAGSTNAPVIWFGRSTLRCSNDLRSLTE